MGNALDHAVDQGSLHQSLGECRNADPPGGGQREFLPVAPDAGGLQELCWGLTMVETSANRDQLADLFGECGDNQQRRDAFARETDPAKQKAIAEQVQLRYLEVPTHVHLGQWYKPVAMRKNIDGMVIAPVVIFWNIEKK